MKCKCGKETIYGRCKSCSNRERSGKFKWNSLSREKRKCEGNPNWKGERIKSYSAQHQWVSRHKLKILKCEKCNKEKRLELANISGKYKRDIKDYLWLCRSCHMKFDYENGTRGRIKNVKM